MPNKRPITTPDTMKEHPDTDALIVGQGTLLAEQGSSLGTPASGYGVIYAKTDNKVYFKNDAGTEFDLTAVGGGGTNPVVREYIANATWTKPTASNFWGVLVMCVGAGGGGGSGRQGAASTARGGGSGGGGGAYVYRFIRAANLTLSTYSITIAAGGIGGVSQLGADTNGVAGTGTGNTSFGSIVIAQRGNNGNAGTTSSATGGSGGQTSSCTPPYGPYSASGGAGASGSATNNGSGSITGMQGNNACPGGAGGGGISTTNVVYNGGTGGSIINVSTGSGTTSTGNGIAGSATGVRNGGNGFVAAFNLIFDLEIAITNGLSGAPGGGAAGDATGTIAGGNGGNAVRGSGGAGGGASTNGAPSGAGGNGGDGLCVVIEYYGA